MKLLFSVIVMWMSCPIAFGNLNIAADLPAAIELMSGKKWSEAHTKLSFMTGQMGDRGEKVFAQRFGHIHYLKGYCELKIARRSVTEEKKKEYFKMASDSMKECFEIYMRADKVHSKSLLYRGQAEQGLGNAATAIELYKLFKTSRLVK